jgi:hypothetical protein
MERKKLLMISAVVLLIFILVLQLGKSRDSFKIKKILQNEIEKQQKQNSLLENEYYRAGSLDKSAVEGKISSLKRSTSQILADLAEYDLKLIDFSSTENELNLNLKGSFKSIIHFIYYLESELKSLKIEEFKIKDDSKGLFFYLKLKNELI